MDKEREVFTAEPEKAEVVKTSPEEQSKVQQLLDGLANGECKGVKGAIAYKVAEYAQQKGMV